MNKTAIKNFAIWARNKLIADISYRAGLMGITADGIHPALPQSTGQTKFYDIGTAEPYAISGEAIRQREHLADLIRRKAKDSNYQTAYKYIIEEVAYTWFNRLIAVRFMEVNDYLPSHIRVLSSDQGKIEPDLVTTPFDADLDFTRDEQQTIMDLKSENKLDELFRLLFIKQCNALNEILPALFEKTSDYTELLLNISAIDKECSQRFSSPSRKVWKTFGGFAIMEKNEPGGQRQWHNLSGVNLERAIISGSGRTLSCSSF